MPTTQIFARGDSNCVGQDVGDVGGGEWDETFAPMTAIPAVPWRFRYSQAAADPIPFQADITAGGVQPYNVAGLPNSGWRLTFAQEAVRAGFACALAEFPISGIRALEVAPTSTYPTSPPAGPNLWTQQLAWSDAAETAFTAMTKAIVEILGGNDGFAAPDVAALPGNLTAIANASIAKWGSGIKILQVRQPDFQGIASTVPFLAAVQAAQDGVAAAFPSNVVQIPTADTSGHSDNLHYDADSSAILGQRLFWALQDALGVARVRPATRAQVVGWGPQRMGTGAITPLPPGCGIPGDLELCYVISQTAAGGNADILTPTTSGTPWTALAASVTSVAFGSTSRLKVFARVVDANRATTPTAITTVPANGNPINGARILTVRGVNPLTLADLTMVQLSASNASSTALNLVGGVVPAAATIVALAGGYRTNATSNPVTMTPGGPLTGGASVFGTNRAVGSDFITGAGWQFAAPSGTTGDISVTYALNTIAVGAMIGIGPGAAPPPSVHGGDKMFSFEPPGAIGFVAPDARVLLKLHERDTSVPVIDEAGALGDLVPAPLSATPTLVDAAMGPGRRFSPGDATALISQDSAGSSLITRDLTIQAILKWDIAGQALSDLSCSLLCRGLGSSPSEYQAYDLRLAVIDGPSRAGSIALSWQDISGVVHTQTAAPFACPTGFTLLTATRRWESPTSVVCRYYIGDILLAEVASSDGDIGGSTAGTFVLGARHDGGTYGPFFCGILDEVVVFDRELPMEEIADTWNRITVYQPLGVQLYRELHDPGFPQSNEPGSDVQLENRWVGQALGFAASRFENIRKNLVPQHAYGQVLADWETVLRPTSQPGKSFDERRQRVLARLRQRLGSSIPGLQGMLSGLLGGADPSQLTFLAFSNTWSDSFPTAIDPLRWDTRGATWSVVTGELSLTTDALQHPWISDPIYCRRSIDGAGRQAHQIAKLRLPVSNTNAEIGIYFGDHGLGNYFLLGLRNTGAAQLHIFTEAFFGGLSQGAVDRGASGLLAAGSSPIWLYLHQAETFWEVSWSLVDGLTFGAPTMVASTPAAAQWAGVYYRTVGAVAGAQVAKFDDHVVRNPFGTAPLSAWVVLDRALGFHPDIPGARQVVDTVRHAYVAGGFATTPAVDCDDRDNGCDNAPLGGY